MALKKKIIMPNGLPLEYHKIGLVSHEVNSQNTILVVSYLNEEARQYEKDYAAGLIEGMPVFPYTNSKYYNPQYDGSMTIEDAYNWVKDHVPEFKDCENVLTPDSAPTAYMYAVAGGEMDISEVPESMREEVAGIQIEDKPAEKVGFICKRKLVPTGYRIVWEFDPDPAYNQSDADGSYLKPYVYIRDMLVSSGMWYTDGDNIWEAIKDGVPSGFDDTRYFDIITQ